MGGPRKAASRAAPADDPDRELLARHAAGDREAFGELFARHRDRLWAVALRTVCNPEDAADALQDAAVSAFRSADRFRGESAVGTWLYRIVVNACLDRLRRKAAHPTGPLPEEHSAFWWQTSQGEADPVDQRELRIVLEQALALLPVDQRLAVLAVDVEGLSVEEAAAALGIPGGTVKSRCARGRSRLADLLREVRNPPGEPPVQGRTAAPGPVSDRRQRGAR
ncbi:MAG TPA: RNA polymerase sigma factor SigM [Actinocrinis sp.]|nr:RNA polymerase sigma factor SigM [Actinocrinis sp.]